jgi:hypothetical protein
MLAAGVCVGTYEVVEKGRYEVYSTVIDEPVASPISVMLNWQPAK